MECGRFSLAVALTAVAVLFAAVSVSATNTSAAAPRVSDLSASVAEQPAAGTWPDTLRRRSRPARVDTRIFDGTSWTPQPKPTSKVEIPTVPPFRFTYAGRMQEQGGATRVFLTRGDGIVSAVAGDTLDGQFRVDALSENELTVSYVPLNKQIVLPLASLMQPTVQAQQSTGATRTADSLGALARTVVVPSAARHAPATGAPRQLARLANPTAPTNTGSLPALVAPSDSSQNASSRSERVPALAARSVNSGFPMLPAPAGTLTPTSSKDMFVSFPPAISAPLGGPSSTVRR